jgi:thymidylate kinase
MPEGGKKILSSCHFSAYLKVEKRSFSMRATKLILIEGISGSGKSTMAHYLSRQFDKHNIEHTWWYEEDKWHPLYPFHDAVSMQQLLDTLATNRHGLVVDAAIELWQSFADALQSSDTIVILDGCLFGYLAWTLFPFDVPLAEIQMYLTRVEQIIRPLNPCLIYLYQQDIASACRRKCQRRDIEEEGIILQATESPYGKHRNLQGFDGLVQYWTDYRHFTDTVFSKIEFAKLSIENSAGEWLNYEQHVMNFLDLSSLPELPLSAEDMSLFTGTYSYTYEGVKRLCSVRLGQEHLLLDDAPYIWPDNRLIPLSKQTFAVDSFPYKVQFGEDDKGVRTMTMTGPEQLFHEVNVVFTMMSSC